MKKLFFGLIVIIGLIMTVLGIFIATFDANRYRLQIITKIESSLGRPVRLDSISLRWRSGVALSIQGLVIYNDTSKTSEFLSIQEADVHLRILPLLKKDFQVSSLNIANPRIVLERKADGIWNIPGIKPSGQAGGTKEIDPSGSAGVAPLLIIKTIKITNGEITILDHLVKPRTRIEIRQLDLDAKDFSLSSPFSLQVKAAIFSDRQNIDVTSKVSLPSGQAKGVLKDVLARINFDGLKQSEMLESLPRLQSIGLGDGLAGKLEIAAQKIVMDDKLIDNLKTTVQLRNGRFFVKQAGVPVENILLDAALESDRLNVRDFSAGYGGGTLKASGILNHFRGPRPNADTRLAVSNISLKSLLKSQSAAAASQIEGLASAQLAAKADGFTWPEISRTLSGEGRVDLTNLALINFNVCREVFNRLSVIPGVTESLRAKLPETYRAKIDAPNTSIAPLSVPVSIREGRVYFSNLNIQTDHYSVDGAGSLGLDQTIALDAMLRMSPELSSAVVRAVNDLQYLQNSQGLIEIPFRVEGSLTELKVKPDLEYAAKRLAIDKAQELVAGFLNKSMGNNTKTAGESTGASGSSAEKGAVASEPQESTSAFANLLQKALRKTNG